jgi:hypothetical protein
MFAVAHISLIALLIVPWPHGARELSLRRPDRRQVLIGTNSDKKKAGVTPASLFACFVVRVVSVDDVPTEARHRRRQRVRIGQDRGHGIVHCRIDDGSVRVGRGRAVLRHRPIERVSDGRGR